MTYHSFFCGENLVAVASIVQKWAQFDLKWAWSEIFRTCTYPPQPSISSYAYGHRCMTAVNMTKSSSKVDP